MNSQTPRPPPPSLSQRYLLVVPISIKQPKDLGIEFAPFHESHSNPLRSIGAEITHLHRDHDGADSTSYDAVQTWIQEYKMKVGDVIYKINNEVVKTRSFQSIIDKLESIFLERRHNEQLNENCTNFSLIMERCDSTPQDDNKQIEIDRKHSKVDSPQQEIDTMSNSMDLSREHNVLNSIFSGKTESCHLSVCEEDFENDVFSMSSNSCISNFSSESSCLVFPFGAANIQNDHNDHCDDAIEMTTSEQHIAPNNHSISYDLSAIPEGTESDTSRETHVIESRPQPQSQVIEKPLQTFCQQSKYSLSRSTQKDQCNEDHQPMPPKTIYQSQDEQGNISQDLSNSLPSSTSFTYSDSECLLSPVGTGIATSMELDSGNYSKMKTNNLCRNLKLTSSGSSHNQCLQFNEAHIKSAYLSPESTMDHWKDNLIESSIKKKSAHCSSAGKSKKKKKSRVNLKYSGLLSPLSDIHHSSSVESCSVSTHYFSPLSNLPMSEMSGAHPNTIQCNDYNNRNKSDCMKSNVPVYMLDYNYVRKCSSFEELNRIIRTLEPLGSGKQQYPSLLRLAKMKLTEFQDKYAIKNHEHGDKENRCDIPSHIHVEIQTISVESNNSVENEIGTNEGGKIDSEDIVENMNSIIIAHAELKDEMSLVLNERNEMQQQLLEDLSNLKKVIDDLENHMEEQNIEGKDRIEALATAEKKVASLQCAVVSSSKEAKIIMNSLKESECKVEKLQTEANFERESKENAYLLQQQLEEKVLNLRRQLNLCDEDNKICRQLVELELRAAHDDAISDKKALIHDLTKQLEHTDNELKAIQKENAALSQQIAKIEKVSVSIVYFILMSAQTQF
jgi:hypothetical protein